MPWLLPFLFTFATISISRYGGRQHRSVTVRRNSSFDQVRFAMQAFADLADNDLEQLSSTEWLDLQAQIGAQLAALHKASADVSRAHGLGSSTARLKQHFVDHAGDVISNYELAGVAGTLEWARRVRELQTQEGWHIAVGPSPEGLRQGEYRLVSVTGKADDAHHWQVRNRIRKQGGSGKARCLAYLTEIFPDAASKEDLAYVARIQAWPRRLRELEEEGWAVSSSSDDPTLPPGSYRLETTSQGQPRSRQAIKQRRQLLERDDWTCQHCGSRPPSVRLQIHHRQHVQSGGDNSDGNLITLCVACHAGEHAVTESLVTDELLEPESQTNETLLDG